ncbi:hypothetical protein SASPL_137847 [Salvia splendens]|uniref:Uncharacterized protein n=1 Tax=Salvia splendens TaxID=180675 RepID=A0A8X8WU76_SALSN|nr:hypothetical protein SASPL_137847 [Salvia splendens]
MDRRHHHPGGGHHHHHPPPPPVVHHHPPPPPVVHHHPPHHHHHPTPVVVVPTPAPPSRVVVVDHHHNSPPPVHHSGDIFTRPSVKMYCKADSTYSLSISHGKVILVRSNPSDPLQHWIKDDKYSHTVRDRDGLPSFALINKATGQALKHSIGPNHPLQLVQYNPNTLDESILWAEKELGDGYQAVRMVNNIRLNFEALHGERHHGGVHDGTTVVLGEWKSGENQRWRVDFH